MFGGLEVEYRREINKTIESSQFPPPCLTPSPALFGLGAVKEEVGVGLQKIWAVGTVVGNPIPVLLLRFIT